MKDRNRLQGSTQEQGSERTDEVINETNREGGLLNGVGFFTITSFLEYKSACRRLKAAQRLYSFLGYVLFAVSVVCLYYLYKVIQIL